MHNVPVMRSDNCLKHRLHAFMAAFVCRDLLFLQGEEASEQRGPLYVHDRESVAFDDSRHNTFMSDHPWDIAHHVQRDLRPGDMDAHQDQRSRTSVFKSAF